MDRTHHGWRDISCCISPPLSPPGLMRQENLHRLIINSSKWLLRLCKNIEWRADRLDKDSGSGGGWAWPMMMENNREKGGAMAIICWFCWSFNSDANLPTVLGGYYRVSKLVKSNHKIRLIQLICTCAFLKMRTCGAQ